MMNICEARCTCGWKEQASDPVAAEVRGDIHEESRAQRRYRHSTSVVALPGMGIGLRPKVVAPGDASDMPLNPPRLMAPAKEDAGDHKETAPTIIKMFRPSLRIR